MNLRMKTAGLAAGLIVSGDRIRMYRRKRMMTDLDSIC